jgi:glycosyltransferase involved in cell wall biosynthesis
MISYHTCPLASEEGKETGGMNVYVLELAKQLSRLGHYVDVFTRCSGPENPPIVQVSERFRLMHILAGPQSSLPKKSLLQYIPEFIENVNLFCRTEQLNYDVMHCHYYMSGIAGLELQKTLGQPGKTLSIVSTFHTLALMKNLVARGELETEDKVRIDAEMEIVKSSAHIIAPSESDASYLEFKSSDSGHVVMAVHDIIIQLFSPTKKIHIFNELWNILKQRFLWQRRLRSSQNMHETESFRDLNNRWVFRSRTARKDINVVSKSRKLFREFKHIDIHPAGLFAFF